MLVRVESNKDIDCVDHSRDIAKDCEQQTDAELYLLRNKKAHRQYVTGIVNINRVTRIKQTIVYRHHCSIPPSFMIQAYPVQRAPLCAGSEEGCQWQVLPPPVQCEETATRT